MKTLLFRSLFFATIILITFNSCSKLAKDSSSGNKARLQVFLTDDPANYDEVLIDVQDIKINFTSDTASGWQSLDNVKKGQYDLLTLVNDKDTMLADAEIPTGRIQQIRLILGSENYVNVNGNMIKLTTPSAQQSGLKLNIHQDVVEGILYKVLLDFDAAKSIVQTGNSGKYILKPTIRTTLEAQGGSIRGWVLPDTLTTAIFAIKGPDTIASTFAASNGGYFFKGMPVGTYSLSFLASDTTFLPEVRNGINVSIATVTVVDTVHLHQ